jgi:hypothetical protein
MHGQLRILDQTGHTTLDWTDANVAEVRARFDEIVGANTFAFARTGESYRPTREFVDTADEIIVTPRFSVG